MEKIDGFTTKKVINDLTGHESKHAELLETLNKIGSVVAQLHDAGIIHGDLTTSNILIRSSSGQPVVIDFGLSFISHTAEDKAVDLYVLERAFGSTHPEIENLVRTLDCSAISLCPDLKLPFFLLCNS